ncbi:AceF protein [Candidatus Pantoea carbekii]|uniref:Acetyltransferase component of pyruvate dehydrogenase complex n=1 Tax=Candidatus Pantoea carbekii TaxID=1235990 RepID=U3U7Y1_9GAMM|nr:AceF protein [Candidatus Pantoea carbekii]
MEIEIKMPDIGLDKVEVTDILVNVGDKVEFEQSLLTVEGDKTSMDVPSPFCGTVKELKVLSGDKVSTGSLIMVFEVKNNLFTSDSKKITESNPKTDIKSKFSENKVVSYVHATPLIRRLAYEFGINLLKIKGTGRKGRILKEDIQCYVRDTLKNTEILSDNFIVKGSSSSTSALMSPQVDFSKFGEIEEIELRRIQKISAVNLSRNWTVIPHVTHFDKVDITELEAFRKEQNTEIQKNKLDLKLTLLVFIMRVVSNALEKMPFFNSSLSKDAQKLILKKYINIGIAMDTINGLVVPVFKDVNKKSINELCRELMVMSKKAHDGKLTPHDVQGGCFTISNLGGLGTTYFSPIVNAPEVAILGVSKSMMEPVWNGKEFTPRLIMPISLSFDHRVIDGADGARFINIIKRILFDIRYLVM